ncbi:uncharacterized protein [Montipora foliosa]|uniref:uncharacterized protein isoform X2 n=1 Tax=Montipora foliosa TaxID=591990 RepID=UPI0035F21881
MLVHEIEDSGVVAIEDDGNDGDVGEGHQDSDDALPSVLATRSSRNQRNTINSDSDDDVVAVHLPVSTSTPLSHQTGCQKNAAEAFVLTLYGSVAKSGSVVKPGMCQSASEVGTMEEMKDHLVATETDCTSGPQFDVRLWQCFLKAKGVPQALSVICLNPTEVRLQSYLDLAPVCIIRYTLTDRAINILRNIMESDCADIMNKCHIHVALVGSQFDGELCGNKNTSKVDDIEVRLLQPTMSSIKMVDGAFLAGHELEQPGIPDLRRAVIDVIEAVEALRAQRDILRTNRELKRTQEQELQLAELEDRRKQVKQTDDDAGGESAEVTLEETVVDSEEVRQRRIKMFTQEREVPRNRDTEGEEDQDNSGTVMFDTTL